MTAGVVVVAAGSGVRLGAEGPKALVPVAGRALVVRAVAQLASAALPPPVVVHPPGHEAAFARALDDLELADLVAGGATRTDSVRAGVAAIDQDTEVVAVHDAARPLMPGRVSSAVLAAIAGDVIAAAPAIPVTDTLKRVEDGSVLGTVDRSGLTGVQTPQAFRRDVLDAALRLGDDATDELALVEVLLARGTVTGRIAVVPGSPLGHKVTYPEDLHLVAALCRDQDHRAPAGRR